MNKEQIDSILAEVGITLNTKKKAVVAGETVSDAVANSLLKGKNTTIEAIRDALERLNKKVDATSTEGLRFGDKIIDTKIRTSAFSEYVQWNKVDEALFGYFYIAKSSDNGGMMLLISNHETQYRCIQLSSNTTVNLSEISEACSKMTIVGDDGETKTLYQHISERYKKLMDRAVEAYTKKNAEEFGAWAVKNGLPSLMINNFSLVVTQEEKDVNTSGDAKATMYKPLAMYFGSDKGGKEFPLDCVAKHYESFASVPSRLARMPKLYSNDFNEPALYHIDLDSIAKPGPHPTWDKYLLRFREDERSVIRAFVWSIFKADNTGRQMLYFYDPDGFSGKSVFEKAIACCLGESLVAALQKDSLNNQFSMAKIWNKRLVVIDDNKNPNLIRSEKVHIVLGSGLADVESKGKNSFMYKMQCKLIASGNTKLVIDPNANHERTRVIIVEPHVTDDMLKEFAVCDKDGNVKRNKYGRVQLLGDANFEKNLIKEFNAFLADCKDDYTRLCPNDSSIIISEQMEDALESLSDDTFDIIDEVIEDTFYFDDKEAAITVREFNEIVEDYLMYELRSTLGRNSKMLDTDDVKQHMIKRYHITKKPWRVDGAVKKCYVGLRRKESRDNKIVTVEQARQKTEADDFGLFGPEAMEDAV